MTDVCPECNGKGITIDDLFDIEDVCEVCDGDGRVTHQPRRKVRQPLR